MNFGKEIANFGRQIVCGEKLQILGMCCQRHCSDDYMNEDEADDACDDCGKS